MTPLRDHLYVSRSHFVIVNHPLKVKKSALQQCSFPIPTQFHHKTSESHRLSHLGQSLPAATDYRLDAKYFPMPLRKASAPPAASGNQPIHDTFFFILAAKTSVLCPSVARHPQQNKTQYLLPNSHCQFPSLWQHTALTELHPFVGFSPVDRSGLPPVPQPLTRRSSEQRWQFFTEAPPPQTVEQRRPPHRRPSSSWCLLSTKCQLSQSNQPGWKFPTVIMKITLQV